MNIAVIKKVVPQVLGRGTLYIRKFSPEILTGVGIVGVIATTVLASKATLKLEPIVERVNEDVATAKHFHQDGMDGTYTDYQFAKDKTRAYTTAVFEVAKLYGPAITLGVASVSCIVGGHGIMRKRNVAMAAAYKAVESSFTEYRKRVAEEHGADKDLEYSRGIRHEEVTDEKGKKTVVTTVDPNGFSKYAKFFDEGNINWQSTPEFNLFFLRCQQDYANDMLQARGYVFLNDVYKSLGIELTSAGQVVGWVMRKGGHDNFVDFGIYNANNEKAREFVNGQEASILLDFNVDGVIYDLI